jgi:hypothetical protein
MKVEACDDSLLHGQHSVGQSTLIVELLYIGIIEAHGGYA